jgi:hypothetical protein
MHAGIISENETGFRGGGVFANSANCVLRDGKIINNRTTLNDNPATGGGGMYLYASGISMRLVISNTVISGNYSRVGGGIARGGSSEALSNASLIDLSGNSVISDNTAELGGGGIHTGTYRAGIYAHPEIIAAYNLPINASNIGIGRHNLNISSTVRFEDNSSQQPVSYSLTVADVRSNSTTANSNLFDRIAWNGRNSADGTMDKDNAFHLFNNHDINNLQGVPVVFFTTLSASKVLSGKYSNMLMEFGFTVAFTDSDGKPLPAGTQFNYAVYNIEGQGYTPPSSGTLTLDSSGSATFTLKHGQTIFIEDVPLTGRVRIVEQEYEGYDATFVDSLYEGEIIKSNDTMLIEITENRKFTFTSERFIAPPTGVAENEAGIILMLPGILSMTALVMLITGKLLRRKQFRGKITSNR